MLLYFCSFEEGLCGTPEGFDLFGVGLVERGEGYAVDGEEGVVCNYIDAIALAKVGVEAVTDGDLYAACETQVVVPRKAGDELAAGLAWSRGHSCVAPVLEEDVAEAAVFVDPEVVAVSAVLFLGGRGGACGPFSPAVEQIAEEEDGVGVENGLEARVGAAKIEIGVFVREETERPWAARVGVRIYELRVGDEDEPVGVCACFPLLPPIPVAVLNHAVEHAPLAPIQDHPPQHHQSVGKRDQPLEAPLAPFACEKPALRDRPNPVYKQRPREPPRLRGQALWFRVCAHGNAILVVRSHGRSQEASEDWRSIFWSGSCRRMRERMRHVSF